MVDGKRFYLQILKRDVGQELKQVHTNIQFVNKTNIAIEYRVESTYWGDMYRKEDSVTDHYNEWDYLYFRYNADMRKETDSIICNIYNLDTKELVGTTNLQPNQNNQEVWGGSVNQARNVLIECIKK